VDASVPGPDGGVLDAAVCDVVDGGVVEPERVGGQVVLTMGRAFYPNLGDFSGFAKLFATAVGTGDGPLWAVRASFGDLLSDLERIAIDTCVSYERPTIQDPDGLYAGSLALQDPAGRSASFGWEGSDFEDYSFFSDFDFMGGGEYRLTGTGGPEVGAFATTVVAPNDFEVTSPALPDESQWKPDPTWLPAGEDLVLRWSPSGSSQPVIVQLDGAGLLLCRFEDDGEAIVPRGEFPIDVNGHGYCEVRVFHYTATEFDVPCLEAPVAVFFERAWDFLLIPRQ
jgi:hypothetical protein